MREKWDQIVWKRACDIPTLNKDGKLAIFYEGIEPNDVLQGDLGSCWFLTAISSLAEWPKRIRALFANGHDEPNEVGIYGVKIYKNGETTDIIVDDWLPTLNNRPVFSHANGHELWVLILEKVWAKLHGSYHAIESGLTHTALRDLTGAPAFITNIKDLKPTDLWKQIHQADKNHWVMAISP